MTLYLFCVVVFIVCVAVMRQIWQSPFGYTLRLIRDNPNRAIFLGADIVRVKLGIFVLAGAMASMGGILLALFVSSAYPDFGFWTTSGEAIFMIIVLGLRQGVGDYVVDWFRRRKDSKLDSKLKSSARTGATPADETIERETL